MNTLLLVGRLSILNQLRRVGASVLLMILPLAFFFAIGGSDGGNALAALAVGLGWAMGFTSMFGFKANAGIDARTARLGLGARSIFIGRMLAYFALAVVICLALALVAVAVNGTALHVALTALLLTALVALPIGALLGVVVPGEIESVFIVLGIFGIPFALPWSSPALKFFPMYGALKYAYVLGDPTEAKWFVHAFAVGAIATVASYVVWRQATLRATALE